MVQHASRLSHVSKNASNNMRVHQQIGKQVQTRLTPIDLAKKKVLFDEALHHKKWMCVEGRECNIADTKFVAAARELLESVSFHTIVDFTAGSGGLLLPLLHEFPNARGIGVDACPNEIECLRKNAVELGLESRCVRALCMWLRSVEVLMYRLKTMCLSAETCLTSNFSHKVVILDAPWKSPLRLGSMHMKDIVLKLVAAGAMHILCKCMLCLFVHERTG